MNKLVLIGNGFDLAHGMRTKYIDFIYWYIKNIFTTVADKNIYEDDLVKVFTQLKLNINSDDEKEFLKSFFESYKTQNHIKIDFKYDFFEKLILECHNKEWVDIESMYYEVLVSNYLKLESIGNDVLQECQKEIKDVNECFAGLKAKLSEYLSIINSCSAKRIDDIVNHFKTDILKDLDESDHVYFLIFNYTSTIGKYMPLFNEVKYSLNFIHGRLNDPENPIIFGYGDEMNKYYKSIEDLDDNEYLKNIKSYCYFATNHYQNFSNFLKMDDFKLYFMGHSCGLSDRVLLNSIVEHSNCLRIKIYFHQKASDENNYRELTQNLSRHFNTESRGKMRNIIDSELDSKPMVHFRGEKI